MIFMMIERLMVEMSTCWDLERSSEAGEKD